MFFKKFLLVNLSLMLLSCAMAIPTNEDVKIGAAPKNYIPNSNVVPSPLINESKNNSVLVSKLDSEQDIKQKIYQDFNNRKNKFLKNFNSNFDLDGWIAKKRRDYTKGILSDKEFFEFQLDYFAQVSLSVDFSLEKAKKEDFGNITSQYVKKLQKLSDDIYNDFIDTFKKLYLK